MWPKFTTLTEQRAACEAEGDNADEASRDVDC